MSEKKEPLFKIQGLPGNGLQLPVWENEGNDGRIRYNTSPPTRSYKDEAGQWHDTTSIGHQHFLEVADMYHEAHARVKEHARARATQQRQEAGPETPQAADQGQEPEQAGYAQKEQRKRAGGRGH